MSTQLALLQVSLAEDEGLGLRFDKSNACGCGKDTSGRASHLAELLVARPCALAGRCNARATGNAIKAAHLNKEFLIYAGDVSCWVPLPG